MGKFLFMKDVKYLFAYIIPLSAFLGVHERGAYLFLPMVITFVLIPIVEGILPVLKENHAPEREEARSGVRFFDWLLYSHLPILYGLLGYGFYTIKTQYLSPVELLGMISALGLVASGFGINIGHELGHRAKGYEQTLAKALLLPSLYMHFFIEHNLGHHKNVATDLDPASARRGETVYAFWVRSVWDGYWGAWRLEGERLRRVMGLGTAFRVALQNEMVWFQVMQLVYLGVVGLCFGWMALGVAVSVAVFSFLVLETVNYIEHYGLRRTLLATGRYEPVSPGHSWNSDHQLGRIFLYELTRHSDHHYKSTRKFQVLRHFEESPELPMGYPASMIMSLLPPLWFWVMDRRLE